MSGCRITIELLLRRTTFIVLNSIEHFRAGEITVKCNTKNQETRNKNQESGIGIRELYIFLKSCNDEIKKIME